MAKRFLRKRIYKADGRPRVAVQAVLWNLESDVKQDVDVTDNTPGEEGLVEFETTNVPEGLYEIRYFGDGIKPTIRDKDGSIISEDPVTPWETNVFIAAFADTEPPDAPLWDTPAIEQWPASPNSEGHLKLNWLAVVDPASGTDGYSVFRAKPDYVTHGEGTFNTVSDIYTDNEDPGWTTNEHVGRVFIDAVFEIYTITANTSNTFTLDLTAKPDPTDGGYTIVEGGEPAEGEYVRLFDTEDETTLTYIDENLEHRHLYYYRLKAHDKAGNESVFSTAEYGIPNDQIAPLVIRNLEAIAGIGRVALTWDPPIMETPEPLHYNIIYCDIPVVGPPQTAEGSLVWKNPFSSPVYGSDSVGSLNLLTDNSGKNWTDDEHIGRILVDSADDRFDITDNDNTTLTIVGTPASGEYYIIGDTTVPSGTSGVEGDMAVSYQTSYVDYGVFVTLEELQKRVYLVRAVDEANNYGPWQQTYEYTPNVDTSGYQPGDGVPPKPPVIFDSPYSYSDKGGNVRLRWKATDDIDRDWYRIFIKQNSSAEEWYVKAMVSAIDVDNVNENNWETGTGIMQSNAFYDSTKSWESGKDGSGGIHAWKTLVDSADNRFIIEYNTEKHLYILAGEGTPVSGAYTIEPDNQQWLLTNITNNGEYKFMIRTVDQSGMVSADSNVIIIDVNDILGPDPPNKPDVASLRGGVLIEWTDVPDWGTNYSLTDLGSQRIKLTDHGKAPADYWSNDQWLSYSMLDSNNKKYYIESNGPNWFIFTLIGSDAIGDVATGYYAIVKEDILFNYEYKYEVWRSPIGNISNWKFDDSTLYHKDNNNCELIERVFLTKNGYFYTRYRDWDFEGDGSIPLEATAWTGLADAAQVHPYPADDGEDGGKVYYAIKSVDEDDNASDWSPISDWIKANLIYEREVEGVIDFDDEHFLYSNKPVPISPSQWWIDWLADDLAGISDPMDNEQLLASINPWESNGTQHQPLMIVQLQTIDRFAEDIEIYWRQYNLDGIERVPQILRIPLIAEYSGSDVVWTISSNVILSNTIKNYEYEFKVRVIDEFGNTSEWNPLPGEGTGGTDWLRIICGIDLPPMFPYVTSRLLFIGSGDKYP